VRRVIVSSAIIVLLSAVATGAQQLTLTPRVIPLDRFTCADLLALKGQMRDRYLVYFNGYINGLRGQKVWDEKAEGERIDRAVTQCRTVPARPLLDVLTDLWPR